ncbi:MAG: hypothetical protein COW01_11925 [Bdellovibrionales bacterium CG12_big_fil_rev_8_21_14_0_65_38_15]|nr:MAG: hypothetical protein COW79_01315 [Bdellovibrionales bacterium CG22_combo_CG10-13_8_21_14_all_38_13]PIQ54041.1 MAG: hypothetical protein COW01_11925 [Bdellovibrionales bacterium CG12_big_fil_rev_8_21_14_0_65_38_15]PIR28566.1 MAG: hypothetical protein COV38_14925 [Bdellovibrionales bacterium CG11_big_fil_rev_8_21_14_0_20_38_13]
MKFILSCLILIWSQFALAQSIVATGRFENFSFEFLAKNPIDLQTECINFAVKQRIAHIDDIYVSFNGNKRLHLHNSDGVWHYPKHFCAELFQTAQTIDITPPSPSEFKEVEAIVRYGDFKFVGSHEAEVFNDCINQLESSQINELDYIRARLVGSRWVTLRNNDGWWRGAQRICTLIDQTLFAKKNHRSPSIVAND